MNILVINAGSSSLKYQLLNPETQQVLAKGLCERIGIDGKFTYKPQMEGKQVLDAIDIAMPTHSEAIQAVLDALVDKDNGVIGSMKEIDAVGHRVVHGGEAFNQSVLITDEVHEGSGGRASPWPLSTTPPTSPASTPAPPSWARTCLRWPCSTPPSIRPCPPRPICTRVPYEYYEKDKVRRYGFHGTSPPLRVRPRRRACWASPSRSCKIISCHLGNGSSVTAIDGGKSVDTSMGFTPWPACPWAPAPATWTPASWSTSMNKHGYDINEMLNILNKKSGVLGVSGVSSDFRDLENAAEEGNERAQPGSGYVQLRREEVHRRLCRRHGRRGRHHLHRRRGRELRLASAGPSRLRPGVHGRQDGRREEQHPRQGGRHLRRRLQGEGAA